MISASAFDKPAVVALLTEAFNQNRSVNYLIKQDGQRKQRFKALMSYAFDQCFSYGRVYLSADKKACALVLFPDQKQLTFSSIISDVKLTWNLGLSKSLKALKREKRIKMYHPQSPLYYLWFIAVDPKEQGKGTGSKLLREIMNDADNKNRVLCLETSTPQNLKFYERLGLHVYATEDFGYNLYFLKVKD